MMVEGAQVDRLRGAASRTKHPQEPIPGRDGSADRRREQSCTMIITEPNKFVTEVHDRMPVLLSEQDYEPWLSGVAGTELLKPAAEDLLQRWPVSMRVNSSRAPDDDPRLIEPITL